MGSDAGRQFHGGDYLSAESSSSLSSAEGPKPRLAPKSEPVIPKKPSAKEKSIQDKIKERKENEDNDDSTQQSTTERTRTTECDDGDDTEINNQQSPLWSLEPRIFATEKGNGKRKYLVGEFGRIADWYWRKTAPASRHLYEVIREGCPCRLYFDLEYSKQHNSAVPEVKLLRELEEELATELQLHYGKILPKLKSCQIVNLDSSNEKKFSRHWVIHLVKSETYPSNDTRSASTREYLFKDAPTVGRFVKRMVGRLADDMAAEGGDFAGKRPALSQHLFVNTKDSTKQTCFIDLGVYTRNRLFRCLGSSKKGKSTKLKVVQRESDNETEGDKDGECENSGERLYFPLTMPEKKEIEPSQSLTSNTPSMETFIAGNDWEPHAQALADSLVVPLKNASLIPDSSAENTPSQILDVEDDALRSSSITRFTDARKPSQSRYPPTTSMARQGSPIPALDHYVTENLATRGGVRGSIRAWSIEYGHRDVPVSLTYHLQRNRFCEIIGRSHKSNNVFWTIDLNSWTCIQGCHDPDCFGRGSPIPISNIIPTGKHVGQLDQIRQEFDSWQEEEFEKALGELNLDDIVAAPTKGDESSSSSSSSSNQDQKDLGEDSDDLSDDALLQAIVDNPELFP